MQERKTLRFTIEQRWTVHDFTQFFTAIKHFYTLVGYERTETARHISQLRGCFSALYSVIVSIHKCVERLRRIHIVFRDTEGHWDNSEVRDLVYKLTSSSHELKHLLCEFRDSCNRFEQVIITCDWYGKSGDVTYTASHHRVFLDMQEVEEKNDRMLYMLKRMEDWIRQRENWPQQAAGEMFRFLDDIVGRAESICNRLRDEYGPVKEDGGFSRELLLIREIFEREPAVGLQVSRLNYGSPGFADITGVGKVMEEVRKLVEHYFPRQDQKVKSALEIEQQYLQNTEIVIKLAREAGFTEEETERLFLERLRAIPQLIQACKLRGLKELPSETYGPGETKE